MDLPEPSPYSAAVQTSSVDARPALAHPRRFLRDAWTDLALAPRAASHLFRANLSAGRRRSLFGYLWLLLPAASTALIGVYLQSRQIVTIAPTVLPYAVHVLAGMVLWQTFLDAFNAPLQQLWGARQLITRSALAHEAVLLAGLCDVALNMAVRLAALAIVLTVIGFTPHWAALALFPAGLVALALLGTALGLAITPLGMLYDDIRRGLTVVTTLWFFLTPVLYVAPSSGPLLLNPVTPLLETARAGLIAPQLSLGAVMVAAGAGLLLVATWLGYRLARPHVIERLA